MIVAKLILIAIICITQAALFTNAVCGFMPWNGGFIRFTKNQRRLQAFLSIAGLAGGIVLGCYFFQ